MRFSLVRVPYLINSVSHLTTRGYCSALNYRVNDYLKVFQNKSILSIGGFGGGGVKLKPTRNISYKLALTAPNLPNTRAKNLILSLSLFAKVAKLFKYPFAFGAL